MRQITRGWLAFAAIGAALIHLALVLGSPLGLSIPLGLLGAVEFGWGVITLSRPRIPFPRIARVVAFVPTIAWSLIVVVATILDAPGVASGFNFVPMGIASLLELAIALLLTLEVRRGVPPADRSTTGASGRHLLGLFVGAIIVAAITAPALAVAQAGVVNSGSVRYEFSDPGHAGH